jgi:prolyl oligopeptidase
MNTNYISTNSNVAKRRIRLWRRPKRRYIGGYVTEDDAYLVISAAFYLWKRIVYQRSKDSKQSSLQSSTTSIVTIVYRYRGKKLFIETDLKAPNKRIVTVDLVILPR